MMEGDGKCRAEAEARGLPANGHILCERNRSGDRCREREEDIEFQHNLKKWENMSKLI